MCKQFSSQELKDLFSSIGWAVNLTEKQLYSALCNSTHLVTYRVDNKLVGLARSMDDDIYSANIDIVVVHKDYQGKGIAKKLVQDLLQQMTHIQYISVSPNESINAHLYETCGFKRVVDGLLLQIENIQK